MRGACTGELYSGAIALHMLRLALIPPRRKCGETQAERGLRLWGALLRAENQQDLDALVEEEPEMSEAVNRLKMLSDDPEVARLARERAEMEYFHELDMKRIREEGEAKGRAEGEAKGRAEGEAKGQAETVLQLIRLRFGESNPELINRVRQASSNELDRITEKILFAANTEDLFA